MSQDRVSEDCSCELRVCEIAVRQIGLTQVGSAEVGSPEVGYSEVRSAQISPIADFVDVGELRQDRGPVFAILQRLLNPAETLPAVVRLPSCLQLLGCCRHGRILLSLPGHSRNRASHLLHPLPLRKYTIINRQVLGREVGYGAGQRDVSSCAIGGLPFTRLSGEGLQEGGAASGSAGVLSQCMTAACAKCRTWRQPLAALGLGSRRFLGRECREAGRNLALGRGAAARCVGLLPYQWPQQKR